METPKDSRVSQQKEMDNREKITLAASELFLRYGIRSVTMDEVANKVGMSKKTLYQSFGNKDELILAVTNAHIKAEKEEFTKIAANSKDSIDEMFQITHCVRSVISNMNPSLLFDLQKYHPKAWDAFLEFKHNFIQLQVRENIERGMKDGNYRKELNAGILAKLRMEQIQTCFNQEVFPSGIFNLLDVQMSVLDHFIHGLLSEDGIKIFKKYKSNPTQ